MYLTWSDGQAAADNFVVNELALREGGRKRQGSFWPNRYKGWEFVSSPSSSSQHTRDRDLLPRNDNWRIQIDKYTN